MDKIVVHFPLVGLRIDPDVFEHLEVDAKAIQSLAVLFGWDGEARRLITCSGRGSLNTVSPPVCCITNKVTSGSGENITFGNIPATEIMIMANPNNSGDIWVNVGAAAAVDTGWVLDAGEIVKISINNMQDLKIHVVTTGDKVIIIRAG